MDSLTLRDTSNESLEGPQYFFTKAKIQNRLGLFDHLLLIIGKGKIYADHATEINHCDLCHKTMSSVSPDSAP